jgi:hypothetical protein
MVTLEKKCLKILKCRIYLHSYESGGGMKTMEAGSTADFDSSGTATAKLVLETCADLILNSSSLFVEDFDGVGVMNNSPNRRGILE